MKQLLKCLSIIIPLSLSAQIQVDDVGEGWRDCVYEALSVIQKHDVVKYDMLIKSCNHIGYWNGRFSTTEGSAILICNTEMNAKCVNDVAAVLVHESMHLHIKQSKIQLSATAEETVCYLYELEFLSNIPNVEPWLIRHAMHQLDVLRK